jgi:hypothetical protein
MSKILTGLVAVVGIGIVVATPVIHFNTMDRVSFIVEHRERVVSRDADGKSSSRFMVWAKHTDGKSEVFENTDSFLSFKFNSADLYGLMSEGAVCDATVNGFRIPFMSMNRNILNVECQK